MIAAGCARAWQAEAVEDGRLSGSERASFKRHAEVCSVCAGEVRALARLRDGLARVPAPVRTPLERGRLRREMLRQANQGPTATRAAARVRRLGAAVALAVVAAAVAIGRLGGGPVPPGNDAVATVPSPSPGFWIQAAPETEWLTVDHGPALRLALRRGQVTIAVDKLHAGQRFLVDLPDGELEVRGTRFVVDAEPGHTTAVTVLEGRVVVRFHGLPVVALGAGEAWHAAGHAEPIAAIAPAPVEPVDPAVAGAHAAAAGVVKERVPAIPAVARGGPAPAPRTSGHSRVAARSRGEALPAEVAPGASAPSQNGSAPASGVGGPTESEAPPSQKSEGGAGTAFAQAMAAFSAGDHRRAERMLLEFEAAHRGDPRVEDAAFLAAVARARQGDRAGARALAQHYLDRYPRGLRRAEAERLGR